MGLKETANIRYYTDKDGVERVKDVVLNNVRFNYTYLINPRPEDKKFGHNGKTYETVVYITDEDAWNVFVDAFNQVYERAINTVWRGKAPDLDDMNLPFKVPQAKEDGTWWQFEEDAIASLRLRNEDVPELFINYEGEPLRPITEDDLDEFYSGMIGQVVFSFWAYGRDHAPKEGIRTFLQGASKTAKGDPVFTTSKEDVFSAFASEDDLAGAFVEDKKAPLAGLGKGVPASAPKTEPEAPTEPAKPSLNDLLSKRVSTTQPDIVEPSQEVEPIQAKETTAPKNILQNLVKKSKQ